MKKKPSSAAKNSWNPFLRECMRLHRKNIFAVVLFSFVINLLMLAVPLYLLQIFNRVVPNKSYDTLLFLTGLVGVAIITLTLLESMRRLVFVRLGSWLDRRLGGLVLSGSIARAVKKSRRTSAQGLRDLATVRRLFSSAVLFPILDAPWTPIFLLVLFILHPVIGFISLGGALALFSLALINELSTRDLTTEANQASKKAQEYAESILRNADAVEAMGMRRNVVRAWEDRHSIAVDLQSQTGTRGNNIASIAKFIRMSLQIILIGAAATLVLDNQISAGALIASLLLMRRAVAPMDRAIDSWKMLVKARNSFGKVSSRLDEAKELAASAVLPVPEGHLSIKNVSFQYAGAKKPTLVEVTFKAHPGEVIALAGETAAGKSTLARLLVGLAEPDSGYVRWGGTDLTRWDAEVRGPLIGYVPQNVELFSGTFYQNITRMGDGNKKACLYAAVVAGIHKMIMRFPDTYETQIGEDGAYLSGGQRQRVALARAMFGEPMLVVLDEPDSNLDKDGHAALSNVIDTLKRSGAIVIVISHQESVLALADRLMYLKRGKLLNDRFGRNETAAGSKVERLRRSSATVTQLEVLDAGDS